MRIYKYYSLYYLTKFKRIPICGALIKYGYSSFNFEILEYCGKSDTLKRESYFINTLKPEYNIMQDCLAPMTGRVHSPETRKLMSFARKGDKHPLFGTKVSDEVRKKMSDSVKGENHNNFGKVTSEAVKAKIIKTKGTAVSVIDLQTNENVVYFSGNQAIKALSIGKGTFISHLKSGKPLKNRYIITKVDSNTETKD